MEKIELITADITTLKTDAVVNAANNSLMGGGGVDGAIHRAAGPDLKAACRLLGGCKTGQSKLTPGFGLPCKYIIHTVGPVWNNGTEGESEVLASCYRTALELAVAHGIRTIAFPAISTGAYRFPFDKAARIAVATIQQFLAHHPELEKVYLVCFSETNRQQYKRAMNV